MVRYVCCLLIFAVIISVGSVSFHLFLFPVYFLHCQSNCWSDSQSPIGILIFNSVLEMNWNLRSILIQFQIELDLELICFLLVLLLLIDLIFWHESGRLGNWNPFEVGLLLTLAGCRLPSGAHLAQYGWRLADGVGSASSSTNFNRVANSD